MNVLRNAHELNRGRLYKSNGDILMRFFVRRVNPILAAFVLAICLYAAMFDSGKFKPVEAVKGGIDI